MADPVHPQPRAGLWYLAAAAVPIAALLTIVFLHALAAYWQFYHLGTGGSGLFLLYIALPGSLLLSTIVVFLVAQARFRHGATKARGLLLGAAYAFLVLSFLLGLEIWSTAAERTGEGIGAGNLAPYLLHHFGVRR
jgi:hypothetical protein